MSRIITLTTDFGQRDGYVAAMKGVILSRAPAARLVDISHNIAPFDVMEAAFVLRQATPHYPDGSIHLVVVDPGVGSPRRGVALKAGGHLYVGPDNGLFSLMLDDDCAPDSLVELDAAGASATFHGRDVFAPAAARLATGCRLEEVGGPIDALSTLHWAVPTEDDSGIRGWIVHIDNFGNCITNVTRGIMEQRQRGRDVKGYVGSAIVAGVRTTYASVDKGEPLLLFGSDDYLEVAVNEGHAASLLNIRRGTPINLVFMEGRQAPSS